MKKKLESSELSILGAFTLIFFSLMIHTFYHRMKFGREIEFFPRQKKIEVVIKGAVHHPGTFFVYPGEKLRCLLKKARPKKNADLKSLALEKRVEDSLELEVGEIKEIEVWVEGAVKNPGKMVFPIGTKVKDLKKRVELLEDVDASFFKSQRRLKDGECLKIPSKNPFGLKGNKPKA